MDIKGKYRPIRSQLNLVAQLKLYRPVYFILIYINAISAIVIRYGKFQRISACLLNLPVLPAYDGITLGIKLYITAGCPATTLARSASVMACMSMNFS